VAARLLSVKLSMGLVLDEVLVEGEGLSLQAKPFEANLADPGSMEVRVSDRSIAAFLNDRAPGGLRDFQVRLSGGLIEVEATASLIISIGVGAVCRLAIQDQSKLSIELVRIESIGGTGAQNLVKKQLDAINPIIDARDLPVSATLESVEVDQGWIVLRGTIAPAAVQD